MKTGFVRGFVNIMKPKPYPYHGQKRSCGIQPEIPPYEGPDMKPVGQEWILAWEGSIHRAPGRYFIFYPSGFLYSSDKDYCPGASEDEKNLYYFVEAYVWAPFHNALITIHWSDGLNCKSTFISGRYNYIYKSWFNKMWYRYGNVFNCYQPGPSSYARVWKSLTGEFPGYYPFPQKEIIRV